MDRTLAPGELIQDMYHKIRQNWRFRAIFRHNRCVSSELERVRRRLAHLEHLYRVGLALGAEQNRDRLVERILLEAKALCRADGGTVYLRTDDDQLRFSIVRNDSLGLQLGGTTGNPVELPPIPMYLEDGRTPNHANVASHCATTHTASNILDAYEADGFDFSGTKRFDERNGYRSQSFLTIPMTNHEGRVIGVLQLLNAQANGQTVPFDPELQEVVKALAFQAGVALDNQILLSAQQELMEAFIKLIAAAIDDKSPYTGGHCRRVPRLTHLLTEAVCGTKEGPLADFDLDETEWYELRIAAWLHDCGKVSTPVHVMDKATKLEAIYDRIAEIRARFAAVKQQRHVAYWRAVAEGGDPEPLVAGRDEDLAALDADLAIVEAANIGGEAMSPEAKDRIRQIGQRRWTDVDGTEAPLLTAEEVASLTISRGTLTQEERLVINGHMVTTIKMLEALPFPRNLRRVPEYAGGHHEKMDGTGYPKGLFAGDMSIPARIMAIADVFEALTAADRPYKSAKSLSTTMKIMGAMKRDNHLDPDLFDIFVKSQVYLRYAREFLAPELIDDVDEGELLAIQPRGFVLPSKDVRDRRWQDFLPAYQHLVREIETL